MPTRHLLPKTYRRDRRVARSVIYLGGGVGLLVFPALGLADVCWPALAMTATTAGLLFWYGHAWIRGIRRMELLEASTPTRESVLSALDGFDVPPSTEDLVETLDGSEPLVRHRLRTMLHDGTIENQRVGDRWIWSHDSRRR